MIFVEPFSVGQNRRTAKLSDEQKKFFTTFNRTDAAEAVYDLLTVFTAAGYDCRTALKLPGVGLEPIGLAAGLQVPPMQEYCVMAFGRMGPVALLAKALHRSSIDPQVLIADMNGFDVNSDAAYVDGLFIPGIRRVGGLPAILAAAANSTLRLHNTAGKLDTSWLDPVRAHTKVDVQIAAELASDEQIVDDIRR